MTHDTTVSTNPYDFIDRIFTAVFSSSDARKDRALCQTVFDELQHLRWAVSTLDAAAATARREAAEAANEAECIQIRLEDIYAVWDATRTGFRDLDDLSRTIMQSVA